MNSRLTKLNSANALFITIFVLLLAVKAQSQNNPQITCPKESIVNICAPVGIPAVYALEDFSPTDDNTPVSEIDFDINQTVTTQTDFTIVSHVYSFTDKDGNSSTCEVVYNIANRFLEAPDTKEQNPICQGDIFAGVKLGAGDYRIYANSEGSQGELLGLCDNPGILCAAEKLGVDGLTASNNQVWVSHFITFPDGSICESPVSMLEIEVLEKPKARLSSSSTIVFPGNVLVLMDLVEENTTGYWSGDYTSSIATADGKTAWVFSTTELGYAKLYYTVNNGPCSESYALIIDVQELAPPPPEPASGAPPAAGYGYGPAGPAGPGGYSGGISGADFDSTGSGGAPPPAGGSPGAPGATGTGEGDPPPPPPYPYDYPPPYPTEQPDAGLITAGEWSDLDNWKFLDSLLNENEYFAMPEYWGFYPQYRVAVDVKSSDNLGLVDATVELSYNDEVKWAAKTDNKGRAELWPSLYQNDSIDVNNLSLIVNGEPIRGAVLLYEDGVNEVIIDNRPMGNNQVEISFIVDATGSMSDELEFLKRDLRDVIRKVEDTTANLNIVTSSVFYRDEFDDYLVRQSDFTTDIDVTIDFIKDQEASGGGDFPEAVHTALSTCLNELQWSASAKTRLAFLLLDVKTDLHASIQQAAAMGIKIIPITASGIDKETEFLMRFFAMATNGTYTFITNDSGIGGNHIEASIGDFEVEKLNDLMVRLILQYTN